MHLYLCRHCVPTNCLTHKVQLFMWTLEYQACFDMLQVRLTNSPIIQLPDPNKPDLLFMDTSKICYSGVLTQASTADSNEALMKVLTSYIQLTSVESQTQDLLLPSNVIHPVMYISGSFSQSQCRWPTIRKIA